MSDTEKPEPSSQYIPPENSIGDRIRQRCKDLDGLSIDELSDLTKTYDYGDETEDKKGISIPTLYRYVKGERLPGARELRLLSEALRVNPTWLLLGRDWDVSPDMSETLQSAIELLYSILEGGKDAQDVAWRQLEHSVKLDEVKQSRKDRK